MRTTTKPPTSAHNWLVIETRGSGATHRDLLECLGCYLRGVRNPEGTLFAVEHKDGAWRGGGLLLVPPKCEAPPPAHLIVRRNGVLCTFCGEVEPVHPGESGTPLPSFLIGLEGVKRRHPPKWHPRREGGEPTHIKLKGNVTACGLKADKVADAEDPINALLSERPCATCRAAVTVSYQTRAKR